MEGLGYIGAWLGQAQPRHTLSGSGNMFHFGQHALRLRAAMVGVLSLVHSGTKSPGRRGR